MTKGAYSVADNNPQPPRKDTSFRSFICALLIFLIICLIILLASIDWGKSRRSQPGFEHVGEQSSIYKKQVEVVGESPPKLNKTHEKIGEYDDVTTSTRKGVIKEVYEDEFGEDKEEVTKGLEKSVSTTTEYHSKEIVGEEVEEGKKGVTEAEEIVTTISSKKILTDEFGDETSTDSLTTTKRSKLVEEEEFSNDTETATKSIDVDATSTDSLTTTKRSKIVEKEEFSNDTETATKSIDVDATSTDSITTTKRSKNEEGEEFSNDTETATKSIDVDATSTDSIITTKRSKNVEEEEFGEYTETATKSIDVDATSTDSITTTKRSKNVESEEFGEDTEGTTKSINVDVTSTDSVTTIRESKEVEEQEVTGEAEVDVASTDSTTTTEKSKEIEIEVTTKSESVEANNKNMTTTDSENEYGVDSTTKIDVNETIDGTTTSNLTNIITTSSPVIVKLNQSQTSTSTTESIAKPLPTSLPKSPKQCNSKNCKIAASQILGKMDHSTEPCVDFYEFACGRANQFETYSDSDIFEKLTIDSSSPKFTQVFKNFSNSCLEYENSFFYQKRMEGLERLIGEVGDFRIGNSTPTNLTELVSLLILRQSMPLFDIGIDVDKETAEFILQLTIPEQSFLHTGIPQWSGLYLLKNQCLRQQNSKLSGSYVNLDEIYESYQECQKNHGSYIDSIENVIRSLSVFSKLDSDALLKAIKGIRFSIEYDILDQLKELPSQETIMMNFGNKNYVLKKISELQSEFKIFDWKKLFEILTGKEIAEDMLVQVYFINYFQKIFTNLLKVDNKELNNAFLAIYAYDLFINTVVPKEAYHRNHFCLDLSKKLLPDIFSYFVGKTIPNSQNNKIKNLFENLQNNFCENLSNAEWVDSASRNSVVEKCRNLNLTFYEPPNENYLIKNFENFEITDYQLDLIHLLENLKQRIYSLAGTPLDPEKVFSYFLNPLSTNPKTFYASPLIMVPLGLSQRALDGLPNYLVQARVGFAFARQLAHHFDSTGVQYGLKLVSIAESTYKEFVTSMTTLMDYESPRLYQNKNISFHINGSLSINERIVDNAAFRLIFDSITWSSDQVDLPWISADYSRQKVFFIATAQEFCKKTTVLDFMLQVFEERHLPAVLRVKNIMGNSENFAEIFSCPEGSSMDSTLKIQFPFLEPVDEEEEYQNIQEI